MGRTYRKCSWWVLGDFWCLSWQQTLDVCSDCLEPGIIHNRNGTLDPLHCLLWKWSSLATQMNTLEICLSWKGDSSSFISWVGTSLPTWAIASLSENLGKRKPSLGMLLQILVATRGNMSLVKLAGENLGIEEIFMAMALWCLWMLRCLGR